MNVAMAAAIGILIILPLVFVACSHTTRIISPQPSASSVAVSLGEPLHSLVIDDVEFTRDGKPENVDVGLVQRLASDLRKSGLFRTVYEPTASYDAPTEAVRVKIVVSGTFDKQWGERIGKDFLVGLSYLALAPVMPYEMEYTSSITATVTLPDESTMEFASSSTAEVKYKYLSDRSEAEKDVKRAGLNDCVAGLLAQMKTNQKFLTALQPQ